eukprot:TRINITY_DN15875_c0_g1_i1.p1 TRINITY_DN15875_c0_g1~~TRINITY_DN15875_c0_g1_i1.p1  ORF type:complete len:330 (+),score=105.35 TRINITY_DN15875_c0_g1_i1:103-1092(+)
MATVCAAPRPCPPAAFALPGAPPAPAFIGGTTPLGGVFGGTRRPVDSFELPGAPCRQAATSTAAATASKPSLAFAPAARTTGPAAQKPAALAGKKAPPPPALPTFPSAWEKPSGGSAKSSTSREAVPPPPPPRQQAAAPAVPLNTKRIVIQDVPWELLEKLGDLKKQNRDLQEAITDEKDTAQSMKQSQPRGGSVDLAHLMELIRDFGDDGLGGSEGVPGAVSTARNVPTTIKAPAASVEVFALGGDADDDDADTESTCTGDDEAAELLELRQELEASEAEARKLREELAKRDRELSELLEQQQQQQQCRSSDTYAGEKCCPIAVAAAA